VNQSSTNDRDDIQLMVQVARLYYENDQNQEEIARQMNITRQKVSRLLIEARVQGIVRIAILDPYPGDPQLRQALKETFRLNEVVLAASDGLSGDQLRTAIGIAAGEHLRKVMQDGRSVGIGWGRTLFEAVKTLRHNGQRRIHVTPLIGGIGDLSPFFQVNELARNLAEAFDGTYRYLYAPAFIQDKTTLESLIKTQEIAQVMDLWSRLDVAVVGIGQVEFQQISSMFFVDHIPPRTLAQLEAKGTVGDICARFFDQLGKEVLPATGVIGVSLDQLRAIPEVIGIAGGMEKVRAVLGALRGGYIKTLITDVATARAVLAENEKRR
jgi:deoxyribonucleoside regulator